MVRRNHRSTGFVSTSYWTLWGRRTYLHKSLISHLLHQKITVSSQSSMWDSNERGIFGTKILISQSGSDCWSPTMIRCLLLIWSLWYRYKKKHLEPNLKNSSKENRPHWNKWHNITGRNIVKFWRGTGINELRIGLWKSIKNTSSHVGPETVVCNMRLYQVLLVII